MNLKEILSSTPADWQARSKDLGKVSFLTSRITMYGSKKIPYIRLYFLTKGITDDYIEELVFPFTVNLIKKPSVLLSTTCKVYCECAAFKYYAAYALKKRGKATVYKKELGKAWTDEPVIRNPEMKPLCCKHLVKVIKVLSTTSVSRLIRTQTADLPAPLKRKIRSLKGFDWGK